MNRRTFLAWIERADARVTAFRERRRKARNIARGIRSIPREYEYCGAHLISLGPDTDEVMRVHIVRDPRNDEYVCTEAWKVEELGMIEWPMVMEFTNANA